MTRRNISAKAESKIKKFEVPVSELRWTCDPKKFSFRTTEECPRLAEFIGQERASRAVEFGLAMRHSGYNIFVAGITGTGKASLVKGYIEKIIRDKEKAEGVFQPKDWCYLYNFTDPDRPQIINLPQGQGKGFKSHLGQLLQNMKSELVKAFTSEDYKKQNKALSEEAQKGQQKLLKEMETEARQRGFLFQITPMGPILIPLDKGKPLSQEEYYALREDIRARVEQERRELMKKMEVNFEKVRSAEKEMAEKLAEQDRKIGEFIISRVFGELFEQYEDFAEVTQYLTSLRNYTLENLDFFNQEVAPGMMQNPQMQPAFWGRDPFIPFEVNVFVDNSETRGLPVIVESNPTYGNIFGKIERRFLYGAYISDHTMIKAGAMSLSNGGYLLLNVRDVLTKPGVWESLKRSIKDKEVRIEDPFEQFGYISSQGMRPQPMPVDVKVVLLGAPYLYQLLSCYDEDFWEIFRVKADFDYQIDNTKENVEEYACFAAKVCDEEKLMHMDVSGIAKVAEQAARMVSDQEKLSTRFGLIKELIQEADYWARLDNARLISGKHVQQAIGEKIYRHNLIDERIKEMIARGTIYIDVAGSVIGQVNGLSLYALGDITFGKPSRITAKTFMGRGGVVNIERESQLSGRIHDKGVMILSGYLGWKYAQDKPLSLSASLCFEQSYEGVEGDSASSTELYAILSSISGVPLRQDIAVTGSVNQKGEVQPIGGINHKIEGFYQICEATGLTGEQGVMMPKSNLKNLMLREDVVEAVKEGKFHIYTISNINEGMEVLTGMQAGERTPDGKYPEETINYLVSKRLGEIAETMKGYAAPPPVKEK